MELFNLSESICYLEAVGLSKVFDAYADFAAGEEINSIGFNENSGYVYIYLENGVSICSCLGQTVEYLINDFETGEDHFFDTYNELLKYL